MRSQVLLGLLLVTSNLFGAPYAYDTLDSWAQFNSMRKAGGGLVPQGGFVRFFMDDRNGAGKLAFVDGNYQENGQTPDYVKYHYDFAVHHFGLTEDLDLFDLRAYFTPTAKPYFAGVLHTYDVDGETVLGAQFYPQDVINNEQIVRIAEILKDRVRIPGAKTFFVATGEQQATDKVAAVLTAQGYSPLPLAEVARRSPLLSIEPGEAEGVLRLFPSAPDRLTKDDIAVLKTAKADLPTVAALVTLEEQTRISAWNLRARELHAPNLVLRDAATKLAPYDGKRVRLKVTGSGYEILPLSGTATAKKIELTWADRSAVVPYSNLCESADCTALIASYGLRAAGRGFLASQKAPMMNGVAVPASWYRRWQNDPASTLQLVGEIRKAAPGLHDVRLRLSHHSADIAAWEGPGRYRAVRVNLDENDVTVARAIRQTYGQLTADLPSADRAALAIEGDLRAGLLVEEVVEGAITATVVTRIPNVTDVYGYFVAGRPAHGKNFEEGAAPFLHVSPTEPIGWSPLQRLSPFLLDRALVQKLVKLVNPLEVAYCQAYPTYYPKADCPNVHSDPRKPNALLVEVVSTASGLKVRDLREIH